MHRFVTGLARSEFAEQSADPCGIELFSKLLRAPEKIQQNDAVEEDPKVNTTQ